jgi:hypothetical protein
MNNLINTDWIVLNHGEPLAKIALDDQATPEDIREAFLASGYAESVQDAMGEFGIKQTLADVKARFYVAAVRRTDLAKQIQSEIEQKVTASVATANDTYNENLLSKMLLAVEAESKNFFPETSAFKGALVQAFKKAGIENGKQIVEETFLNHGLEFFKNTLSKAAQWASFSPEAMKEIEASVHGMGHRDVEYGDENEQTPSGRSASTGYTPPGRGTPLTTYGQGSASQRVAANAEDTDLKNRYKGSLRGIRRGR